MDIGRRFLYNRIERKCHHTVIETREVPKNRSVLKDEIIVFSGLGAAEKCPYPMRRIELYNAEKNKSSFF